MKYKYKIIGSIFIVIILVICTTVGYYMSKPTSYSADFVEVYDKGNSETKTVTTKDDKIDDVVSRDDAIENIVVHIEGAVNNPNTYDLKSGSRVRDLILAAGGYKESADKTSINPAEKLKDGAYIYVYSINEPKKIIQASASTNSSNNAKGEDGKININEATKEQLDAIDGIGEKTASKIVEYRDQHGSYKSIDELKNIGARIGDKTIEKFKDLLTVN